MTALQVILDTNTFNISMEEFAVLQNVYSFMDRLGYGTKGSLIGDLEMFLDEEGEEEYSFSREISQLEQATIRNLIPKLQNLTDDEAKRIDEAFEKSQALFDIFYFFNPLDRLGYIEPLVPRQEELLSEQSKLLSEQREIAERAIKLAKEGHTNLREAIEVAKEAIAEVNTTTKDLKPTYIN